MVNFSGYLKQECERLSVVLGPDPFLDYDALKQCAEEAESAAAASSSAGRSTTPWNWARFMAEWYKELQRVRRAIDVLIQSKSYCTVPCGPARCECTAQVLTPQMTRALVECICLNREGFRKAAKKYAKHHPWEVALRTDPTYTFDMVMGSTMDFIEHQMLAGTSIRSSEARFFQCALLLVFALITAVALMASKATALTITFVLGLVAGFLTAWANAANDICNAVGTAVGSGALSLLQAVVLGAMFEVVGCLTMGPFMSKSIVKGIITADDYDDMPAVYAFGMMAVLFGTAVTTMLATFGGYPISATHGIIGGLIAIGVAAKGFESIGWSTVGVTAIGWVASPMAGCVFSVLVFALIHFLVYRAADPVRSSRHMQPLFIWFCFTVQALFMLIKGPDAIKASTMVEQWEVEEHLPATVLAILVASAIGLLAVPTFYLCSFLKRKYWKPKEDAVKPTALRWINVKVSHAFGLDDDSDDESSADAISGISPFAFRTRPGPKEPEPEKASDQAETAEPQAEPACTKGAPSPDASPTPSQEPADPPVDEAAQRRAESEKAFVPLLIISALSVAVAHGGNDVGNAVGPLTAIYHAWNSGEVEEVPHIPFWAICFGSLGFVFGILTMGRLTIKTVGTKLTSMSPSKAFATQLGGSMAVLGSSAFGLPVSTSHCLVGSVVGIGLFEMAMKTGRVNWGMLYRIVLAWCITIPLAMIVAYVFFAPFQHLLR